MQCVSISAGWLPFINEWIWNIKHKMLDARPRYVFFIQFQVKNKLCSPLDQMNKKKMKNAETNDATVLSTIIVKLCKCERKRQNSALYEVNKTTTIFVRYSISLVFWPGSIERMHFLTSYAQCNDEHAPSTIFTGKIIYAFVAIPFYRWQFTLSMHQTHYQCKWWPVTWIPWIWNEHAPISRPLWRCIEFLWQTNWSVDFSMTNQK